MYGEITLKLLYLKGLQFVAALFYFKWFLPCVILDTATTAGNPKLIELINVLFLNSEIIIRK